MFDEMDRLRERQGLHRLLHHYQEAGTPDRKIWQDRLQELDGVSARDLVKLHGELLAHGWLELNLDAIPTLCDGTLPACYRITSSGLRALAELREEEWETSEVA
jgi:hypothetical protein